MAGRQRKGRSDDHLISHMMMTMKDNVEILTHEDDDIALKSAAIHCRLPHDKLTGQEMACFPDIARAQRPTQDYFLYLRNKILQQWLLNPRIQLTFDCLCNLIPSPFNSDKHLIKRVHGYLDRYGYINFGFVQRDVSMSPRSVGRKSKVIILGGGVSGLAAARQLKMFGCEVVVVEARNRVGGRIATYRHANCIADIGAMVVTGLAGNPVTVLSRQIPMTLQKLQTRCPIFDINGRLIDKEKDEVIEKEFNRLLDACAYLAHSRNISRVDEEKLSLGVTLDIIFKQQEKRVREKKLEFWLTCCQLQEKAKSIQGELVDLKQAIQKLRDCYMNVLTEKECWDDEQRLDQQFRLNCFRRDLTASIRNYDLLEQKRKDMELALAEMRRTLPSDVYMNLLDRRILDWHIANLEYANATCLNNLSLKHWDQDDEFELAGCHMSVKEGFGVIPQALARDLDVRLKHVVKNVFYDTLGVSVTCGKLREDNSVDYDDCITLTGDACLCTLPLGVLKDLTKSDNLQFDPPLPAWKQEAIERLGFGNLNKVILCFDKIFWDQSSHLFGHTNESNASRGEMFLFWTIYDCPVLIALIAGQSADLIETVADDVIVKRCMTVLASIFGNTVPFEPVEAIVTRWRQDRFARGSYSYVTVDATGEDYEMLARPVGARLFFAGEHTQRSYPASVHGAFLSGLREAARIADRFLPCPYSPV